MRFVGLTMMQEQAQAITPDGVSQPVPASHEQDLAKEGETVDTETIGFVRKALKFVLGMVRRAEKVNDLEKSLAAQGRKFDALERSVTESVVDVRHLSQGQAGVKDEVRRQGRRIGKAKAKVSVLQSDVNNVKSAVERHEDKIAGLGERISQLELTNARDGRPVYFPGHLASGAEVRPAIQIRASERQTVAFVEPSAVLPLTAAPSRLMASSANGINGSAVSDGRFLDLSAVAARYSRDDEVIDELLCRDEQGANRSDDEIIDDFLCEEESRGAMER